MPLIENFTMREGQTETLTFVLTTGGGRPRDLSSATLVKLTLVPAGGTGSATSIDTTTNPTKLAISTATSGEVQWSPADGDVTQANSPYLYFFQVTISKIEMYPNDKEVYIKVLKGD